MWGRCPSRTRHISLLSLLEGHASPCRQPPGAWGLIFPRASVLRVGQPSADCAGHRPTSEPAVTSGPVLPAWPRPVTPGKAASQTPPSLLLPLPPPLPQLVPLPPPPKNAPKTRARAEVCPNTWSWKGGLRCSGRCPHGTGEPSTDGSPYGPGLTEPGWR